MREALKYISLFSGIEAASVAWQPLGWTPLAFAEIEPFPCAVLAHHFPAVPNHGDVTAFDWSVYRGECNLIVGGSPCQSFSVAGLRGSLSDDRGNLALAFCKITHDVDPEFVVYENVPGLLNTRDNAFGCLLAGLVGEDDALAPPAYMGSKWPDAGVIAGPGRTAAWRVLDAQFFGVPQRRRRVFVVSVRGSCNWSCAEALFPLSDGLPWDIAPSREAGARVAASLTRGADSSGKGGYAGRRQEDDANIIHCEEVSRSLTACKTATGRLDPNEMEFVAYDVTHSLRADGFDASEDGTGRGTPLVPVAIQEDNQNGVTIRDTAGSLRSDAPGTQPCGTLIGEPIAFDWQAGESGNDQSFKGKSRKYIVRANGQAGAVNASRVDAVAYQCHGSNVGEMGTLRKGNGNTAAGVPFIAQGYTIHGTNKTATVASEAEVSTAVRCRAMGRQENSSTTVALVNREADAHVQMRSLREGNDGGAGPCGDSEGDGRDDQVPGLHPVAFQTRIGRNGRGQPEEVCPTLQGAGAGATSDMRPCIASAMAVRRLLPLECERLQGFPDDWTLIPYNGKPAKDGPRYRAIGNSMAVPVLAWIGRRIIEAARAGEETDAA